MSKQVRISDEAFGTLMEWSAENHRTLALELDAVLARVRVGMPRAEAPLVGVGRTREVLPVREAVRASDVAPRPAEVPIRPREGTSGVCRCGHSEAQHIRRGGVVGRCQDRGCFPSGCRGYVEAG